MDNAVETSSQRIRNHLRAPIPGRGELLNENARNTVNEIVPVALHGVLMGARDGIESPWVLFLVFYEGTGWSPRLL